MVDVPQMKEIAMDVANDMTEKLDLSQVRFPMKKQVDWGLGRTDLHRQQPGNMRSGQEYWSVQMEGVGPGKTVAEIFDPRVRTLVEDALRCAVILHSHGFSLDPAELLKQLRSRT